VAPSNAYAIPAGMHASQVWATPSLRQGKEIENYTKKLTGDGAQEDFDGQGHYLFSQIGASSV